MKVAYLHPCRLCESQAVTRLPPDGQSGWGIQCLGCGNTGTRSESREDAEQHWNRENPLPVADEAARTLRLIHAVDAARNELREARAAADPVAIAFCFPPERCDAELAKAIARKEAAEAKWKALGGSV